MRGMHIHQHQALGVFRKNVDTLELRQCKAQRRYITLPFRQRRCVCLRQGRKEFAIGVFRLADGY